jgi:hypothetical protein
MALSNLMAVNCGLSRAHEVAQWFFSAEVPVVFMFQRFPITNGKSSALVSSAGAPAQAGVQTSLLIAHYK